MVCFEAFFWSQSVCVFATLAFFFYFCGKTLETLFFQDFLSFLIRTMNVNIEFSDGITLPLILFKVSELPSSTTIRRLSKNFSFVESMDHRRKKCLRILQHFFFIPRHHHFMPCYCIKEDIFKWFLGSKKSRQRHSSIQPNSLKIDFAYRNLKSYIKSWMRQREKNRCILSPFSSFDTLFCDIADFWLIIQRTICVTHTYSSVF